MTEALVAQGLASGLAQPRLIEEWVVAYEESGLPPELAASLEAR